MELREQWKAKRNGFADLVSQHADTSEAIGRAFAALLDEMRLSLMGTQANVLKRQCIGLLFAQAQAGAQWLGSLNTLVTAETVEDRNARAASATGARAAKVKLHRVLRLALKTLQNPIVQLSALGVIAVLCLMDKAYAPALIAAALLAAVYLTQEQGKGDATQVVTTVHARAHVDTQRLMELVDAQMEALAHQVDDLAILDEEPHATTDAPQWQLEFFQRIWEAADNQETDECLQLCHDALTRYGLKLVPYNGNNAPLFHWLRTSGETAMVYPAICRRADDALVLHGKAISPNP